MSIRLRQSPASAVLPPPPIFGETNWSDKSARLDGRQVGDPGWHLRHLLVEGVKKSKKQVAAEVNEALFFSDL
ncbi:MAG: hypothetical protein C5B50_26625 [Verrucomicrobia bacterium]|nr:MAG: hypothetical protein C5B50_26625 [Verrucomicrobiota bacterium]